MMIDDIDAQDRRVLAALQGNCRMSTQELAEKTHMSPATSWRRVRALEERGIIKTYSAILDRRRLGYAIRAFAYVSIDRAFGAVVEEIASKIAARPEVLECYATTGDADFTLHVVAKDIEDYDRFLSGFLLNLKGVGQVRSSIALRAVKETTALPL
ncbi:MAG: Lrp/AsnC family transcriptional regulator [Pseudomonadota bacterium]